jgi:hypothetical protein
MNGVPYTRKQSLRKVIKYYGDMIMTPLSLVSVKVDILGGTSVTCIICCSISFVVVVNETFFLAFLNMID